MLPKINGLFRLTRDAEMAVTPQGMSVLKLGLAASEKYKDKETQLFIDATAFGKPAEIINQYSGAKGSQIFISGKLQTESWQDKNTGDKRYKTTMIVEGFEFVGGQKAAQPQVGGYQQQQPQQGGYQQQPQSGFNQAPNQNAPQQAFDDTIPF